MIRRRSGHPILALFALTILFAGVMVGLLSALQWTQAINAGLIDDGLPRELTREFGGSEWVDLGAKISRIVWFGLMLVGMFGLLIARRETGAAHCGRAALGSLGLAVALKTLADAMRGINWFEIRVMIDQDQVGRAIQTFLERFRNDTSSTAAVIAVVSLVMLAWPAKRKNPLQPNAIEEGASS